jgi:2-C-methyl-D-erythritol 4-phosphate cytidylyltransferase/2-C-methyl-D-erythritol 2,4-cyclodiphosphate synthase
MVAHTLAALAGVPRLAATLVVLAPGDDAFEHHVPGHGGWTCRRGGATRAASVANGLDELLARGARDDDWVLVHDAARCLVRAEWVDRLIDACSGDACGGLLALPLADTLKCCSGGRSTQTIARDDKWAAQTPQMFRIGMLRRALAQAGDAVTDEASAMELAGHAPLLVPGAFENLKVTAPGDFDLARRLLESRQMDAIEKALDLRIGEGWDIHALQAGRPLVLGGVTIPHTHGLAGHSDADALLHAVTDAVLGGASLGDIGRHFPDTDPAFAGADSHRLLTEAARRVRAAGWQVVNVDGTIVAQAPKMAPHIDAMRERIAAALAVTVDRVSVKAKTAEKMGPVGEGRAIETRAVCLLARRG